MKCFVMLILVYFCVDNRLRTRLGLIEPLNVSRSLCTTEGIDVVLNP